MKKQLILGIFVAFLGINCWGSGENLVKNGDFSQGLKYWNSNCELAPGPRFSWHRGNVMWQSQKNAGYVINEQKITSMKPGRFYQLSGEIKCENLVGYRAAGATICLEFYGQKFIHNYIYGAYPGGIKGNYDWTKIYSVVGPIPPEVQYATVGLYVQKNNHLKQFFTGKAWWRNIELVQIPLTCQILAPHYKMNVERQLELKFQLWPQDWGQQAADWQIKVQVFPKKSGKAALSAVFSELIKPRSNSFVWAKNISLSPGTYELQVVLTDNQGQSLWNCDYEIYKKDLSQAAVQFDQHRRFIVNGQPFFVFGSYCNTYNDIQFNRVFKFLTGSGLNTLLPYNPLTKAQMDKYHQANKKIIYSVMPYFHKIWYSRGNITSPYNEVYPLAREVKMFRNHPALLAWYTNDEQGLDVLDCHERHYEVINRLDDNHPAFNLHNCVHHIPLLSNHSDIMGIDEYPITGKNKDVRIFNKPIRAVNDIMESGIKQMEHRKPLIAVLQNYDVYGKLPTIKQIRNMSYQALAAGASGIVYYMIDDNNSLDKIPQHWQDFAKFTKEFIAMKDIYLSVDTPAKVQVQGQNVSYFLRKYQGKNYLFLINLAEKSNLVTVNFPANVPQIVAQSDKSREVQLSNGRYQTPMTADEVQIIKF